MNIFKILANGDGSINEANVSAFLGYLLNPYADHGLGFEFLDSFLKQVEIQDGNFYTQKYDYEIFFEQAFKIKDKPKQIVDIVVLCINNNFGAKKESYVKSTLSNNKKVEYIFLIENKIKKTSKKSNQIDDQKEATSTDLSNIPEIDIDTNKIYSIYLTPKDVTFIDEFEKFDSATKKHIFWKDTGKTKKRGLLEILENIKESIDKKEIDSSNLNTKQTLSEILKNCIKKEAETNVKNKYTILDILKDIIEKEASTEIDPINEYTKQTIKAFIQFVENNFKSEKQEKQDKKYDGSYTKTFKDRNEKSDIVRHLNDLRNKLISKDSTLTDLILDVDLSEQRYPSLPVKLKDIILKIRAHGDPQDRISFIFKIDRKNPYSREKIILIAKGLNVKVSIPEGYSYCFNDDMRKEIPINEIEKIYIKLKELIHLAD